MMKRWRFQIRAFLMRLGLWGPIERLRLRLRFGLGIAHEPEFEIFRRFDGTDQLFVDVGANLGQSALSFRLANRSAPILSFEPNPQMQSALEVVQDMLGDSFQFRMVGLGARTEVKQLFFPIVKGVPFLQCATFVRDCLVNNPGIQQLFFEWTDTREFDIVEQPLPLLRFDELALNPGFIKIDAEGGEADVIAGMTETIARCRPLILAEGFGAEAILRSLGYVTLVYQADGSYLRPMQTGDSACNVFYAPVEKLLQFEEIGVIRSGTQASRAA